MEKSDDDCYFYYYSTCTKGEECPYRHCQLALGSEVTCTHWQNGKCMRPSVCKYRHMESRINRSSIQCWFETQPIGCRKPHCVFLHKKPRNLTLDEEQLTTAEGLILPVATAGQTPTSGNTSVDQNNDSNRENSCNANNTTINTNNNSTVNSLKRGDDSASKMKLFDDSDYLNQSLTSFNESSANIEPISISLNDCDEESDNESERNSDQISDKSQTQFEYKTYPNKYNSSGDYGIKTLEQIRMEKVFNSQTEDSLTDDNDHCFDNFNINDTQIKTQKLKNNNNKDLRVKIKRQKFNNSNDSFPSASNLNRISSNTSSEVLPDFGIKSLDQIRKEREDSFKKIDSNAEHQSGLKENQEPKGQKRSSSDPNPSVIKIRRTGPIAITSLKIQQNSNENKDNCIENNDSNCEQNLSINESSNQSNVVSSTDTNRKHRIKSIDTDLDEFDLFDGESTQNMDSNEAIDDDEDDELMREINQVINS